MVWLGLEAVATEDKVLKADMNPLSYCKPLPVSPILKSQSKYWLQYAGNNLLQS